mmetsp:Transcript_29904/g.77301  ORF Transcript_29904/g.77301 Transcript_29904/m.77301 type:complete len:310 (+) Transcript_29904:452-1381(+)
MASKEGCLRCRSKERSMPMRSASQGQSSSQWPASSPGAGAISRKPASASGCPSSGGSPASSTSTSPSWQMGTSLRSDSATCATSARLGSPVGRSRPASWAPARRTMGSVDPASSPLSSPSSPGGSATEVHDWLDVCCGGGAGLPGGAVSQMASPGVAPKMSLNTASRRCASSLPGAAASAAAAAAAVVVAAHHGRHVHHVRRRAALAPAGDAAAARHHLALHAVAPVLPGVHAARGRGRGIVDVARARGPGLARAVGVPLQHAARLLLAIHLLHLLRHLLHAVLAAVLALPRHAPHLLRLHGHAGNPVR